MPVNTAAHPIKNEIRENLSISVPLIASQLIYSCSTFIGTAMAAHLGETTLAASVLVSMIWWSLSVFFFGVLNSISVLVSHQYGARNYNVISELMGQSFILGFLITVVLVACMQILPMFFHYSTQPESVIHIAKQYMRAQQWSVPGLVILIILEQFLMGINRNKLVLRISMLIVPIEIPIIYALMFGRFGFPKCGVAGIGYGFAISYTITTVFLCLYLIKSKEFKPFNLFSRMWNLNLPYLKELIYVGLPMGFMHTIEVIAFAIITFWIARFGTTILAAHQITMQFLGFFITLSFAMSQAVTVRVGYGVGKLDKTIVHYASYVGVFLNTAVMLVIAFGFVFFPNFFLQIDLNVNKLANADLIRASSSLLGICGLFILFDNARIVGFGALRALKDTHFPMLSSFISFWLLGLSLAYLFAFHFGYRGNGIWWGLTIGIGVGAVLVFSRLRWLLKTVDLNEVLRINVSKDH